MKMTGTNDELNAEKVATYRIQKIGGSSMITIPPQWMRDNKMKEGDTVSFFRRGERLYLEKEVE